MNKILLRGVSLILAIVLAFGGLTPGGATSQAAALTSSESINLAGLNASRPDASTETIYNDKHPAIQYSSGWKNVKEKKAYKGSFKVTQNVGSHATLNFNGEAFSVIYKTGPMFGNMDVYVDGTLVGTIDQKSPAPTFQQKWTYGGTLAPGTHTLKLVYASPLDARVSIDAVSILTSTVVERPVQPPADIATATVMATQTVPLTLVPVNTATPATVPTMIAPTTQVPTTAVPTNAVTATATTTQVPVQPSATLTLQPTNSPPQSTGSGLWISSEELMSLPTSGTAWDKLRSTAYGTWGTADLKNQDNKHAIYTLAGALVYARTGDASLRIKVRDQILAAKRTLDESAEWQTDNGVLAASRQIGAYVIAADLVDLKTFDAAADQEFRSWLAVIRTTNIGTHGRWKALTFTCENATSNWGTFACASRIAASIYLGDTADVDRAASIIRALFGDRSAYPADAPGKDGYFQHTGGYQSSWSCDDPFWTGINQPCVKSGLNIDGVLVEDASRGGGCCILQGDGIMYSWEALQGLFVSTELLYRTGRYGNPYDWSNQALKRTLDFMQRSGWGVTSPAKYVPWMANYRYNTRYPTTASPSGRIMSWGDWLYQP